MNGHLKRATATKLGGTKLPNVDLVVTFPAQETMRCLAISPGVFAIQLSPNVSR